MAADNYTQVMYSLDLLFENREPTDLIVIVTADQIDSSLAQLHMNVSFGDWQSWNDFKVQA